LLVKWVPPSHGSSFGGRTGHRDERQTKKKIDGKTSRGCAETGGGRHRGRRKHAMQNLWSSLSPPQASAPGRLTAARPCRRGAGSNLGNMFPGLHRRFQSREFPRTETPIRCSSCTSASLLSELTASRRSSPLWEAAGATCRRRTDPHMTVSRRCSRTRDRNSVGSRGVSSAPSLAGGGAVPRSCIVADAPFQPDDVEG
jgi:hypothetical protein